MQRRAMLTHTSGALAAIAAFALPAAAQQVSRNADAKLLDLCERFHELDAQASNLADDRQDAIMDKRWAVSDEIQALPATTLEGMRAKAAVSIALVQETHGFGEGDSSIQFALAALNDFAWRDVA